MNEQMNEKQIAARMSTIGRQVRYASKPSALEHVIGETICALGVLAILLFLYVALPL